MHPTTSDENLGFQPFSNLQLTAVAISLVQMTGASRSLRLEQGWVKLYGLQS